MPKCVNMLSKFCSPLISQRAKKFNRSSEGPLSTYYLNSSLSFCSYLEVLLFRKKYMELPVQKLNTIQSLLPFLSVVTSRLYCSVKNIWSYLYRNLIRFRVCNTKHNSNRLSENYLKLIYIHSKLHVVPVENGQGDDQCCGYGRKHNKERAEIVCKNANKYVCWSNLITMNSATYIS